MNQVANSPLPALLQYYDRLQRDPDQSVAEFGFSREKIHFQVVLDRDGSIFALEDIREANERGRSIHRLLLVPDGGGRSGTSIKPNFCWDNTGYVLGRDNKGKPDRADRMFEAFRELHLSMRDRLADDEGYTTLCRFLEAWQPDKAEALPNWEEAAGKNVVFVVRGREGFVHQSEAVKVAWLERVKDDTAADAGERGVSLLSGDETDLARLHPLISGVTGANTTGAAIVSFNLDAFTSYGKSQSYNAPLGVQEAFRYTTALNRLLANGTRRVRIGDATVVFWSDRAEAADAEEVLRQIFGEEVPEKASAEHGVTVDRVRMFLDAARKGRLVDELDDPKAPFYILGLSPNASRINVRYWLPGTVQQFAERLAQHAEDLDMVGGAEHGPPLPVRRILDQTARDRKDVPPQLAGALARAVLGGLPYPPAVFSGIIRRVRVDATINHQRAAFLKAFLRRNKKKEVPMALNKDHPDEAYHLGRLFAALEKTQEDASKRKLNSTLKDKYFGAAAATPASVFPRLLQLHQHHMNKIENPGFRVNREKMIGEICGHLGRFPSHLPLDQQGLFYIAYYHQREAFLLKKETAEQETNQ